MPVLQHLNTTAGVSHTDYEWRYEYYDDEEPVSFEGLKAHKCKSVFLPNVKRDLASMLIVFSDPKSVTSHHSSESEPVAILRFHSESQMCTFRTDSSNQI